VHIPNCVNFNLLHCSIIVAVLASPMQFGTSHFYAGFVELLQSGSRAHRTCRKLSNKSNRASFLANVIIIAKLT
jgi:hypothetical protein